MTAAGYENSYYYIRLPGDVTLSTVTKLKELGYTLKFLKPPFRDPAMLKKRY